MSNTGSLNSQGLSNSQKNSNYISIDNSLIWDSSTATKRILHNMDINHKLKIYEDQYEHIDISLLNIKSSIYEYELFSMIETIKKILLTKLNISEEEFNKEYENNKIQLTNFLNDKLTSNKIIDKLTK